jgi:gliding motility-associated-like protein
MNRILIVFLAIVFVPVATEAQLVRFDFENYTGLPDGLGQWFKVQDVLNPSANGQASPDYFHVLGTASCDLPETPFAIVPTFSGQAMMGLAVASTKGTNTREYLSLRLPAPLEAGSKYKISIPWTMGSATPVSIAGLTVSDLGVLLSSSMPIQMGVSPISETPQFVFHQEMYSTTWKVATIEFVAQDPAQFITIGLFGSDDNKAITNRGNDNSSLSYYFFDQLAIEKLEDSVSYENPILFSGIIETPKPVQADQMFVPNSFTPNEDGTNDAFMQLDHEVLGWDLKIFNRWGQLIFASNSATQGWTAKEVDKSVNAESFFWTLEYINSNNEKTSQKGNVYLIR